ncbi:MAG: hypothetical protein CVU59_02860 [Deltaproteobacteria bacterium HGW-Deltaproteobacteria-17]|nr:MAG: hypothetical protein CVU59_02860 [Deltaproteobacteria bacterium HGW-Deltaproteobacteria-17]
MMPRALLPLLLPLLLTAMIAASCDRSAEPGFQIFDLFEASGPTDLSTPIRATAAQRQHDARAREGWGTVLNTLETQIDTLDRARRFCSPAGSVGQAPPPAPQDRLDRESFLRLQTQIETASEKLKTDIAQLDPTGARSALFLPARRLSRTIGTVLLSTLEISCGTQAIFDARLQAARRQLKEMRDYVGRLPRNE